MNSRFMILVCCLFFGGSVFAKTFYVDSQSGSDDTSGTAVSKAWRMYIL